MPVQLKRPLYHAFLLLLVPIVVFFNSLQNGFVWDDTIYLVGNPAYVDFDLRRILTSLANAVEYLPVRDISYALDYLFWGESSRGFHATNLLLYILVCGAVYLATQRMAADLFDDSESSTTALAVALLFCVHPLHVEVVAFVTSRNTLLAALFFFFALYLYLTHLSRLDDNRFYGGALLCFFLAVYAKAIALILPLVLLICLVTSRQRNRLRAYLHLIPFLLTALGTFWLFRAIAQQSRMIDASRFGTEWQAQLATTLEIPWFYLGKFLLPTNLAALYQVPFSTSLTDYRFIAAAGGTALTIFSGIRLLSRHQPAIVLLLMMTVMLLPVLHLFPTSPVVADRYFFIPSYAAIYLLVYAIQCFPWRSQHHKTGLCLLIGAAWSVLCWQQNQVWKSDLTLWQHAVRAQPAVSSSWGHLGREYFVTGSYVDAFASFSQAREINPADPNYDFFQGYLCYVKGDTACALNSLTNALQRDSQFIEALDLLGDVYASRGEWAKAGDCYRRLIASTQVDPGHYKRKAGEKLIAIGRYSLPGGESRP